MDITAAAQRWGTTWQRAWAQTDVAPIAALYSPDVVYRSHPHREPEHGGALGYVSRVFSEESNVECRFGEPIAVGDRAAVEWWASMNEGAQELTLSGATVLRFDADGLVIEHVDYWGQSDGRLAPYTGWGRG
ncbi:MAG: nuclear transport factor 2 family protein [Actinomycetia bacterium]|nr:nuclear transport factor 2 family protein [Actinomycetes bacterium]